MLRVYEVPVISVKVVSSFTRVGGFWWVSRVQTGTCQHTHTSLHVAASGILWCIILSVCLSPLSQSFLLMFSILLILCFYTKTCSFIHFGYCDFYSDSHINKVFPSLLTVCRQVTFGLSNYCESQTGHAICKL